MFIHETRWRKINREEKMYRESFPSMNNKNNSATEKLRSAKEYSLPN
jgi:hypothetical protein